MSEQTRYRNEKLVSGKYVYPLQLKLRQRIKSILPEAM
jgi:hypothetical protein